MTDRIARDRTDGALTSFGEPHRVVSAFGCSCLHCAFPVPSIRQNVQVSALSSVGCNDQSRLPHHGKHSELTKGILFCSCSWDRSSGEGVSPATRAAGAGSPPSCNRQMFSEIMSMKNDFCCHRPAHIFWLPVLTRI